MTKRRKKNSDWSEFTTSKTNAEKNASKHNQLKFKKCN